jgi:hypothetical protein
MPSIIGVKMLHGAILPIVGSCSRKQQALARHSSILAKGVNYISYIPIIILHFIIEWSS